MEYKDYYAVLGVKKQASEKEIRQAFRRLARQYHPDVNPSNKPAEEHFKEINEAYEVLSDPEKRRQYDEMGADWERYQEYQRAGPQGQGGGGFRTQRMRTEDLDDLFGEESPYSDFFEQIFGRGGQARGGGGTPRPQRGLDLEAEVEVTLEEAARGTSRVVRVAGEDGRSRQLEVRIPPGVRTGTRVRVAGQGESGRAGGARGDVYLLVQVLPHSRFERKGDDLHLRMSAAMTTMLLGGEVAIPTLDSQLMLKIPAGTPDGKTFRLRGKGMPRQSRADQHGDLLVEVHAALPPRISVEQRRLIEQFARIESGEPEEGPLPVSAGS
jgi:DnaJ-class molecular chaperone